MSSRELVLFLVAITLPALAGCAFDRWAPSKYEPKPGQIVTVTKAVTVETEYGEVRLSPGDWVVRPRPGEK